MAWHRLLDHRPEKKGKAVSHMEFLKSLVPAVISGEGPLEHGTASPRETGPRLLRKRFGLLAMGQTIEEDPVDVVMEVDSGIGSSRPVGSYRTHLRGMMMTWSTDALFFSTDL